jgi:hypothetical protein
MKIDLQNLSILKDLKVGKKKYNCILKELIYK